MKRVYWKPQAVSRTALILIAVVALASLFLVERLQVVVRRPYYDEKLAAAELAAKAMERIHDARLELGPEIDPATDPTDSGIVGLPMSEVTSISVQLPAKQTSINPNFAAVVVDMLKRAGVKKDDVVAVGCSGSFPGMNICVYAALETLGTRPVVISSAAASQWGANVPTLLWIDMERILAEDKIFNIRSVAASIGGYEDSGLGLSPEGMEMVMEAITRNKLRLIDSKSFGNEAFQKSVEDRMGEYKKNAGARQIVAYINVGGGTVSVGRSLGKKMFEPGLNKRAPKRVAEVDGVMPRFAKEGRPTINLIQVVSLAEHFGLPVAPTSMPEPGQGDIFEGSDYNKFLVLAALAVIVFCLYGFIHSDIGFRLMRLGPKPKEGGHPQPMV